MKRAVIYCRVSTDEQAGNTSLETQEAACRRYADDRGWTVVDVFHEDFSGESLSRPELTKVRHNIRDGYYDVFLAYAVDRLSRDQIDTNIFYGELRQNDVAMDFASESFEDSAMGRMILQFRAMQAEEERRKILERTMRGKVARLQQGGFWAATTDLYGYRRTDDKRRRKIHDDEATVVRQIFDWVDSGRSLSWIAKTLNEDGTPSPGQLRKQWRDGRNCRWFSSSISQLLKNPAYKGWTTARRSEMVRRRGTKRQVQKDPSQWFYGDKTGKVTPAIVDESLWDRVNEKLVKNVGDKARNEEHFYLLRGRVYCGKCGQRMYPQRYARQPDVYVCSHKYRGRGDCSGPGRERIDLLESHVWMTVTDVFSNPAEIIPEIQRQIALGPDPLNRSLLDSISQEIRGKERQADQLMKDLRELGSSERIRNRYRSELENIEKEIEQLEERAAVIVEQNSDEQEQLDLLNDFVRFLDELLQPLSPAEYEDPANWVESIRVVDGVEYRFRANVLDDYRADFFVHDALDSLAPEVKRQIIDMLDLRVTVHGREPFDYEYEVNWRPVQDRLMKLIGGELVAYGFSTTTCRTTPSPTPA